MPLNQPAIQLTLALALLVGTASADKRIAWYGVLEDGLAEAKESGRPILLLSAAPQCHGVPGIW